jgi:serine protease Do
MEATETPRALASDLAAVAGRLRQSTVELRAMERAIGSGIIWRADGLIVTCAHVVAGRGGARGAPVLRLADGRVLRGTMLACDRRVDLALLGVEAHDLPAASIGDSDRLRAGELVLAVGHPFGLIGAVVTGVAHAASGPESRTDSPWIRADLRLAPGHSGGPMADARGRVVGVNTMIAGGLALAVPSRIVEALVERCRTR